MAKSKWPQVQKRLSLVEKWCRDGLTEKQVAKNLGISETTLYEYKNRYPEFVKAINKGKEPFIAEVENALAKRALGFEYEESKTYIKQGKDGEQIRYTEKTKKYQPPDVAACFIILKNKDKDENGKFKWSNNPAKVDLEKEMLEFKKEIERMKNF
jgi:transcriptional regulator with XRE-family HTH domain